MNFSYLFILFSLISIITSNENNKDAKNTRSVNNSQANTYNEEERYPEEYEYESKGKDMTLFNVEWTEKMSDYESQYVYMIPVAYKARQVFYENITQVPTLVRGAFVLDEATKEKIDFTIKGPTGTNIYSNTTHSAIFMFNATEAGIYEIAFINRYKNAEIKPTFTMNTQQNQILQKDDLNQTESSIDQMITFLKGISTEDKMKRNIHRERYLSK